MFQNGYPSRRRSLVDDARFETLVVKQTKQSVLEEARARANGKSNEDKQEQMQPATIYKLDIEEYRVYVEFRVFNIVVCALVKATNFT